MANDCFCMRQFQQQQLLQITKKKGGDSLVKYLMEKKYWFVICADKTEIIFEVNG